jgi:hypothetical protein
MLIEQALLRAAINLKRGAYQSESAECPQRGHRLSGGFDLGRSSVQVFSRVVFFKHL